MALFGPYPARVVRVIDGDTIIFDIDLGFDHLISGLDFDGKPRLSCRVFGINAPELRTPEGDAAKAFAQGLFPVGKLVHVWSHGWDKYGGRFDGDIILPDGSSYGDLALAAGHAVVFKV